MWGFVFALLTVKFPYFLMNSFTVFFYAIFSCGCVFTLFTGKVFNHFMHFFDMSLEVFFMWGSVFALLTGKVFDCIRVMSNSDMPLQAIHSANLDTRFSTRPIFNLIVNPFYVSDKVLWTLSSIFALGALMPFTSYSNGNLFNMGSPGNLKRICFCCPFWKWPVHSCLWGQSAVPRSQGATFEKDSLQNKSFLIVTRPPLEMEQREHHLLLPCSSSISKANAIIYPG